MININLIVIKTKVPEILKKQYEILGLTFHYHRHGKGPFHYSTTLGELTFEIYPLPKHKNQVDDDTRLGFELDHLDELIHQLQETNWEILNYPKNTAWGYVAVLKDLDGRKVELKERRFIDKKP